MIKILTHFQFIMLSGHSCINTSPRLKYRQILVIGSELGFLFAPAFADPITKTFKHAQIS